MVYPGVIELSSNEAVLRTQSTVGRIRNEQEVAVHGQPVNGIDHAPGHGRRKRHEESGWRRSRS